MDTWYPTQEAKRVQLTHVLVLVGIGIELCWSLAFLVAGSSYSAPWRGVLWYAIAAASLLLIPLINRRPSLRLFARLALLTLANCWIFVHTALFLGKSGDQYCFLPMTSLPFILFETRNRISTSYGMLLPQIMFVGLEVRRYSVFPESMLLPMTRWIYWMTIGTAFCLSFLAVYFYRQANEKFEHELRESQGRFVRIVEAAQEGIIVCNDYGKVAYANPALAQRLGMRQDKLVGRAVTDFISPSYRQRVLNNVLHLKREEVEFIRPDG